MLANDWQQWLSARRQTDTDPDGPQLVWLADYGLLRFSGPDVQQFLLGYLTIDPARLARQPAADGSVRASPFAICNLKGRVLVNGWCWTPADEVVDLLIHRSLSGRVPEFLKAYLAFSRTGVTDLTAERLLFASWPAAGGAADGPARDAAPAGGTSASAGADAIALDDRHRLLVCDRIDAASALVAEHGLAPRSRWQSELVASGVALVRDVTSERHLPQMLDLDRLGAVSFDKGCYLGQEVVARAQHRGQVKRRLVRLQWREDPGVAPGVAPGGAPGGATTGEAELSGPSPGEAVRDGRGRDCGQLLECAADDRRCLAVLSKDPEAPLHCAQTVTQAGVSLTLDPVL